MPKRIKLSLLCLVFCCVITSAKGSIHDSIYDIVTSLPTSQAKGEYLFQLAKEYKANSPEMSVEFGLEALVYLDTNSQKKFIAKTLNLVSWGYKNLNNNKKAIRYAQECITICQGRSMESERAEAFKNIGVVLGRQNKHQEALQNYEIAKQIYLTINDKAGLGKVYLNKSNILNNLGDYEGALQGYYESLKLFEQIQYTVGIASASNNIGAIHSHLGEYEDALKYYIKAMQQFKVVADNRNTAYAYNNIGVVYTQLGKYEKASEYFHLSLTISKQLKDQMAEHHTKFNMIDLYIAQKDYKKAELFANKSLEHAIKIEYEFGTASSYERLGRIYKMQRKYNKAKEAYKKSMQIVENEDFLSVKSILFKSYSELLEEIDSTHAAFSYYKKHKKLEDSIFSIEKNKSMHEMEAKYNFEKKEKEILSLQSENKIHELEMVKKSNHLTFMFVISSLGLILLIIIIFSRRLYIKKSKRLQQEISVRKRSEQDLKNSEEKYRTVVDNANEGIAIIRDNTIAFINPYIAEILGYKEQEIIGKPFNYFVKKGKDTNRSEYKIKSGDSENLMIYETTLVNKLKEELLVEVNTGRINYKNKLSKLVLIRNITEVKKSEKLQYELDAEQRASKIKQQFLANMGHEIRTPMNGIIGMSDLLKATAENKETREHAEIIRQSSSRLMKLIDEIFEYTRLDAGKTYIRSEQINVKRLFEDIKILFNAIAKQKKLEFEILHPQYFPEVITSDKSRLLQILTNLVSNAFKFTDEGHVYISYKIIEKAVSRKKVMLIEVEDTGIGIGKMDMQKLFRLFTQIDTKDTRVYDGTGLGLATAKELVELLDGKIYAKSDRKSGSTFSIEIPTDAGVCQPVHLSLNDLSAGNANNLRMLAVETKENYRKILEIIISSTGGSIEFSDIDTISQKKINEFNFMIVEYSPVLAKRLEEFNKLFMLPPIIFTVEDIDEIKFYIRLNNYSIIKKPFIQKELFKAMLDINIRI